MAVITIYILLFIVVFAVFPVYSVFTCTKSGRFLDPESADCSGYILCIQDGTSFITAAYTCPTGSLFNSETSLCTTASIVCNTTSTSISTSTSTPIPSSTSTTTSTPLSTTTTISSTSTMSPTPTTTSTPTPTISSTPPPTTTPTPTPTTTMSPSTTTLTTTTTVAPCTYGFLCLTDSLYLTCIDLEPAGSVMTCPDNTVCSNDCQTQCTGGTADCNA